MFVLSRQGGPYRRLTLVQPARTDQHIGRDPLRRSIGGEDGRRKPMTHLLHKPGLPPMIGQRRTQAEYQWLAR